MRTSVVDPERKSANKILQQLIKNVLAKKMNLDGGNGKIAFRSLNLYKVFQGNSFCVLFDPQIHTLLSQIH